MPWRRPSFQRMGIALLLLLLPTALLFRPLFLGEDYVPFDLTTFAPWSISLTPEELAARRKGGNYDITEKTLLCSPEYLLAREEILDGRFPHWDPYVRTGSPLFANALDGFAYPGHWPFFFLGIEGGADLVAWIAFAVAGLLMFGFLRSMGLGRAASLFGAVAFQFSGTLSANGHFFMRMEVLSWAPGCFWALLRLHRSRGPRGILPFAGLSFSFALCWLAGFPPYALAVSLALGLYGLVLLARSLRVDGFRQAFSFGFFASAAVGIGILIAAIQLLPMLDYFPDSQRNLHQNAASLASQGLEPFGWLGLILPSPFGDGVSSHVLPYDRNPLVYLLSSLKDPGSGLPLLPNYNGTEYALYLGALPFLSLLLALFSPGLRFRTLAFGGILLFLALATGGFLYSAFAWFGPLRSIPPMRLAGVVGFFAAALAGMGLDAGFADLSGRARRVFSVLIVLLPLSLLALGLAALAAADSPPSWILERIHARWAEVPPGHDLTEVRSLLGPYLGPALHRLGSQALRSALFFGIGAALLLLAMRGRILEHGRRHRGSALLRFLWIAVTLLDLVGAGLPVNPSFPHRDLSQTPVHDFLRSEALRHQTEGGFMVARVARTATPPEAFPPDLLIPLRIRDLNAYAFVDGRSHLPFLELYGPSQMIRGYWLNAFPADARLEYGLFDLLGVRYLLSREELPGLGKPVIPPLSGPGGKFLVYERKTALSRAFLVERGRYAEEKEALERLVSEDFDPLAEVLLHEVFTREGLAGTERPPLPEPRRPSTRPAESAEVPVVEFREDRTSSLRLVVRRSPGAWLLLADTAMPHWRCLLDGQPVPWWRANLFLRAVWIPQGDHEVLWQYDPSPFRKGLWISGAACAFLLLLLLWWNGWAAERVAAQERRQAEAMRDLAGG